MKTLNEIKSELSEKDYCNLLKVTTDFVLENSYPNSMNDSDWQGEFTSWQSTLPEHIRPFMLDVLTSLMVGRNC